MSAPLRPDGHTPLPWKYVPWHIEEGPSAVRAPEGWLLANTSSDADAEFIVRACNAHYELLTACQAVVDACTSAPPLELVQRLSACAKQCDAAISRAEGRP